MQVKSIAECFLQYFQPSLSYHLSSLYCLFLSDRLRQVLLYLNLLQAKISTFWAVSSAEQVDLGMIWSESFLSTRPI